MDIKTAKYFKDELTDKTSTIYVENNGDEKEYYVPIDEGNSDYIEIMRQVDAGELTIEEAE